MKPTLTDLNGRNLTLGDFVEVISEYWHCRGRWGGYTVLENELSFVANDAVVTTVDQESGAVRRRELWRMCWDIRDVDSIEILERAKA